MEKSATVDRGALCFLRIAVDLFLKRLVSFIVPEGKKNKNIGNESVFKINTDVGRYRTPTTTNNGAPCDITEWPKTFK